MATGIKHYDLHKALTRTTAEGNIRAAAALALAGKGNGAHLRRDKYDSAKEKHTIHCQGRHKGDSCFTLAGLGHGVREQSAKYVR